VSKHHTHTQTRKTNSHCQETVHSSHIEDATVNNSMYS